MADEALMMILRDQGPTAWNAWRRKNPDAKVLLTSADLAGRDLRGIDLSGAVLRGANLWRVDLTDSNCSNTDLRDAYIVESEMRGVDLSTAKLQCANLSMATLAGANLWNANLAKTNLRGTSLASTNLKDANLGSANLSRANLFDATLINTLLNEATLDGSMMGATVMGNVDISTAKGLESVNHVAPSVIGLDTIYRSGGNIPESFLRGAGVLEDFIIYMRSLAGKALEFYSCFISYSSKDQEFVERLHADLQRKGVRCWFAAEDLKIGDKFRTRIEESIRLYDKLMVVLSENSIQSSWVEEEVEAALEKERQHPGTTTLFPIRLDDAVMGTKQAWAAGLRRMRHIGEFNNWKDHDRYKKAFDRLLRDLKAEDKVDSTTK